MHNDNSGNSSFFEKLAPETPPPSPSPESSQKRPRPIIFGIFGLILLVAGLGTGAILVQQNQNIRSNAALPPGCNVSYSGSGTHGPTTFTLSGTCPGQIVTYNGSTCPTTSDEVSRGGAGAGSYTANAGADECQQVDYQPQNDPSQGIGVCNCTTGGTSTPPPTAKNCGESCTSDSQCENSNPASYCASNGKCERKNCPLGQTAAEGNCTCLAQRTCGQTCGFASGTCQSGYECRFINVPDNSCQPFETQGGGTQNPNQVCLPTYNTGNDYQQAQCSDMASKFLVKPDGSTIGITTADLTLACAPQTPVPSSSPQASATPSGTPLVCGDIKEIAATDFTPFNFSLRTTGERKTTKTYIAPNIPGHRIVGVDAFFDDRNTNFAYQAFVTEKDGSTLTQLVHECSKSYTGGWIDVCTARHHRILISAYDALPEKALTDIRFIFRRMSGDQDDEVYFNSLTWQYQEICRPTVAGRCMTTLVYDTNWALLGTEDLKKLKAGDVIRVTVSGASNNGNFDKARFTINGSLHPEVASKKPGSNEYYEEYTIPTGAKSFSVKSQVHHEQLNQWF
jgi:hypothetical protein